MGGVFFVLFLLFADSRCDQLATRAIMKANLKDKTKTKQGMIEIKKM